jgi:hypothetical protein
MNVVDKLPPTPAPDSATALPVQLHHVSQNLKSEVGSLSLIEDTTTFFHHSNEDLEAEIILTERVCFISLSRTTPHISHSH